MESIKADINDFLRYGCGGGIFLISLIAFNLSGDEIKEYNINGGQVAVLVAVSLGLGSMFYSFHRGLIYPIIWTLQLKCKNINTPEFLLTDFERELHKSRWLRRGDKSKGIQSSLDRWGAHSHFLYVAAISTLSALIVSELNSRCGLLPTYAGWLVLILIFLAAVVNDARCIRMEIAIHEGEKKEG